MAEASGPSVRGAVAQDTEAALSAAVSEGVDGGARGALLAVLVGGAVALALGLVPFLLALPLLVLLARGAAEHALRRGVHRAGGRLSAALLRRAARATAEAGGERCGWLAALLDAFWAKWLGAFLSRHVSGALAGALREIPPPPPPLRAALELEAFDLGDTAPCVRAAATADPPDAGDDLTLDLALSWPTSNMKATLAAHVGTRGVAVPARVHVTGVTLEGTLRVGFRLIGQAPYVRAVRFAFVEVPKWDAHIAPLVAESVAVNDLPGVERWIRSLISALFEMHLVAPRSQTWNVADTFKEHVQSWEDIAADDAAREARDGPVTPRPAMTTDDSTSNDATPVPAPPEPDVQPDPEPQPEPQHRGFRVNVIRPRPAPRRDDEERLSQTSALEGCPPAEETPARDLTPVKPPEPLSPPVPTVQFRFGFGRRRNYNNNNNNNKET